MSPPHRIFFSYARSDSGFALRLAQDLRSAGVSIWIDQLDIPPGLAWDREVEKALQSSAGLLVVLSPNAVASDAVMDEVSYALDEGKSVFPVIHKKCQIPLRLRRVQHIDLADDYSTGMGRLVHALGGKEIPAAGVRRGPWLRWMALAILALLVILGLTLHTLQPDCDLRSNPGTANQALIVFTNLSSDRVEIYWLDYSGSEKIYAGLDPGFSTRQSTFIGHAWCVRNARTGDPVEAVTATKQEQQIVIR